MVEYWSTYRRWNLNGAAKNENNEKRTRERNSKNKNGESTMIRRCYEGDNRDSEGGRSKRTIKY